MTATLMLAMAAPSCRLFRRSSKSVPPPPPPPPVETTAPKPQPSQPSAKLPPPPQLPPGQPDLSGKPPEPAAVKLPPPPRRRGRNKKEPQETVVQPAQPPAGPEAQASPEPPTVPQLEPILTPEQRQAYIEAIDTNIARAQRTLELLQGRRLDAEQKMTLDRIRAFLEQANETRKTDLFRAKNLAERAGILADDLLRSMQ
jgi:hypothetical protein